MKQRKQIIALLVLVIILAGVAWNYAHSNVATKQGTASLEQPYAPLGVESPAPRVWEMDDSRKTEYSKTLRNIFSLVAPPPEQSTAKVAGNNPRAFIGPERPLPPVPPSLPVTFFGYGTVPNGTARRAFLTNKEDIYIVGEGDTLLGRFRILKINNATIEFEEISTGLRNTSPLVLEEAGAGPPAPPGSPTS